MKVISVDPQGNIIERELSPEEYTIPSPEEIASLEALRLETLKSQKRAAFQSESDPIFFKAQRGEATMDEWIAKVSEIEARFANPEYTPK